MWEFIVSGYIPGTSVQISFETWLYAIGAVIGLTASVLLFNAIKNLAVRIVRTIRNVRAKRLITA